MSMPDKKEAIEVFPGSIRDLELMTDKNYKAMKDENGNLATVIVSDHWTSSLSKSHSIDESLSKEGIKLGADALVNVTYISVSPHPTYNGGREELRIGAKAYAVKEVKK